MPIEKQPAVGVVAYGLYLAENWMTAKEVADFTKGVWTESAVIDKLGFTKKPVPGPKDENHIMGANAALDCLQKFNYDPKKIDVILCIGEEWQDYPLTTSGIYIQAKIGATNAWALDVQLRCSSMIAAMKIAKDMLIVDDEVNSVMIVGGCRNGDFVDYNKPKMSSMFSFGAGACAVVLEKNARKNLLLGSHIMTDGLLACGEEDASISGDVTPAYRSLDLMIDEQIRSRVLKVVMSNWLNCIDKALLKSKLQRQDIDYLAVVHFKYSMHLELLESLGLKANQTTYLSEYGHIGQVDQILSLHLGLESGKIRSGSKVCLVSAGIGYSWAANVIQWGDV